MTIQNIKNEKITLQLVVYARRKVYHTKFFGV